MQKKDGFDDLRRGEAVLRKGKMSIAEELWCLTSRKVLMSVILFSSMRSLKAFSWLLQYSPYTEKLSLCKTEEKHRSGLQTRDLILYFIGLLAALKNPLR